MTQFSSYCDEFYVNMSLNTELELPRGRETLLHFFEQLQKHYPTMRNFYSRDRGEYIIEEDKDSGAYRWTTVEAKRISSGYVNPESIDLARDQHRIVLESVPYTLSVSPLDCESLDFMYGFDFSYRGNHHALIAEALGMIPAFEKTTEIPGFQLIANDPAIQFSIDDECRMQCRVSIESRTSAYHIRTGEFPDEQISVYLTMRRYGSLDSEATYIQTLEKLHQ
ncbi:MAG: hypothetical protein AAGA30_08430, partial [Planctomycetota bacterium]